MDGRDPIGESGVRFSESWLEVEEGVHLRALTWTPRREQRPPLLVVPGWISGIESWREILRAVAATRRVVYLESREKPTARLEGRLRVRDLGIESCASDLRSAMELLGLAAEGATAMGSSLGATAILEAMKNGGLPVSGSFLIGPNARFRIPLWARPLLFLPSRLYRAARHLAIWYLEHFRVDAKREPEQMERYRRAILAAEPRRLKKSARALAGYTVWPGLDTIRRPVAVAWAPTDSLHHEGDILRLLEILPRGVPVRCPSNRFMHTAAIVPLLEEFEARLRSPQGVPPPAP